MQSYFSGVHRTLFHQGETPETILGRDESPCELLRSEQNGAWHFNKIKPVVQKVVRFSRTVGGATSLK